MQRRPTYGKDRLLLDFIFSANMQLVCHKVYCTISTDIQLCINEIFCLSTSSNLDGPLENVIRQRKKKNLSRGRRQKRGTSDSAAEQGVAEAEMVPESSEDDNEDQGAISGGHAKSTTAADVDDIMRNEHNARWKRILLLIVAITVHNIPEGMLLILLVL